jgi:hypothetical protein
MIKQITTTLFICIFLTVIWNCKNEQNIPICNKVIHIFSPPSFTVEQEQIINKYRDVIYSKLLHPDVYFFHMVKERPDTTYLFKLLPLNALHLYHQADCGSIMTLDSDVWFVVNESGEIIESNELGHPFKDEIFW